MLWYGTTKYTASSLYFIATTDIPFHILLFHSLSSGKDKKLKQFALDKLPELGHSEDRKKNYDSIMLVRC